MSHARNCIFLDALVMAAACALLLGCGGAAPGRADSTTVSGRTVRITAIEEVKDTAPAVPARDYWYERGAADGRTWKRRFLARRPDANLSRDQVEAIADMMTSNYRNKGLREWDHVQRYIDGFSEAVLPSAD